ncbi:hypothetical protein JCM10213_006647 [Rhodosporidiobolus nylandii]
MLLSTTLSALVALAPVLSLASPASPASPPLPAASADGAKRPNIVFIIVDDQDARQDTLGTMQSVQRLLVDQGTQFERFYAPISALGLTFPQCSHSTNLTDVMPPLGGWTVFNAKGMNAHYLPTFLQQAGFATYYTGKLMNGHSTANQGSGQLEADGWTDHAFLLDPNTYDYWNPAFSTGTNGSGVEYRLGEYSTDVVKEKALEFLEKATEQEKPFFLGVAPIAPHSHISAASHSDRSIPMLFDIPRPHPRHAHLFQDVKLNTSRESFNPDVESGASWVRRLKKLNETNVEYIEQFYRGRLRSLQAVDELVESVVNRLEELGILEETLIIYTADNGFEANAGHRRQPGKTLLVRGPGVPRGLKDTTSVYSLADLGATILHLAGAEADYDHDGALVPLTTELRQQVEEDGGVKQFHLAEYWVRGVGEGKYGSGHVLTNQTYRAIRVVEGADINYYYAVWCTGEREIYDMNTDPDQMHNLALDPSTFSPSMKRLHARLDALLLVLKDCRGDVCRKPWTTIFPAGGVKSLRDALAPEYDSYFAELPKVQYSHCEVGYFRSLEKPHWADKLAYSSRRHVVDAERSQAQVVFGV